MIPEAMVGLKSKILLEPTVKLKLKNHNIGNRQLYGKRCLYYGFCLIQMIGELISQMDILMSVFFF